MFYCFRVFLNGVFCFCLLFLKSKSWSPHRFVDEMCGSDHEGDWWSMGWGVHEGPISMKPFFWVGFGDARVYSVEDLAVVNRVMCFIFWVMLIPIYQNVYLIFYRSGRNIHLFIDLSIETIHVALACRFFTRHAFLVTLTATTDGQTWTRTRRAPGNKNEPFNAFVCNVRKHFKSEENDPSDSNKNEKHVRAIRI